MIAKHGSQRDSVYIHVHTVQRLSVPHTINYSDYSGHSSDTVGLMLFGHKAKRKKCTQTSLTKSQLNLVNPHHKVEMVTPD